MYGFNIIVFNIKNIKNLGEPLDIIKLTDNNSHIIVYGDDLLDDKSYLPLREQILNELKINEIYVIVKNKKKYTIINLEKSFPFDNVFTYTLIDVDNKNYSKEKIVQSSVEPTKMIFISKDLFDFVNKLFSDYTLISSIENTETGHGLSIYRLDNVEIISTKSIIGNNIIPVITKEEIRKFKIPEYNTVIKVLKFDQQINKTLQKYQSLKIVFDDFSPTPEFTLDYNGYLIDSTIGYIKHPDTRTLNYMLLLFNSTLYRGLIKIVRTTNIVTNTPKYNNQILRMLPITFPNDNYLTLYEKISEYYQFLTNFTNYETQLYILDKIIDTLIMEIFTSENYDLHKYLLSKFSAINSIDIKKLVELSLTNENKLNELIKQLTPVIIETITNIITDEFVKRTITKTLNSKVYLELRRIVTS